MRQVELYCDIQASLVKWSKQYYVMLNYKHYGKKDKPSDVKYNKPTTCNIQLLLRTPCKIDIRTNCYNQIY